jgi:hypothetical protein
MGWYTVTKTIKGRKYTYRQRTWREGGKVRTQSVYLGPANDVTVATGGLAVQSESVTMEIQRLDGEEVASLPIQDNSVPPPEPDLPQPTFHCRADVARQNVSAQALRKEEERVIKMMEAMGIDCCKLKPVVVAFAGGVKRRRSWITGKYIVTLPRPGWLRKRPSRRNSFKAAYREALAERWLDALKKSDKRTYRRLKSDMELCCPVDKDWRNETIKSLAEVIQHGFVRAYDKHEKRHRNFITQANRRYGQLKARIAKLEYQEDIDPVEKAKSMYAKYDDWEMSQNSIRDPYYRIQFLGPLFGVPSET